MCFTEESYPFVIEPKFSISGSTIEITPKFNGTQISFVLDSSITDLLGFNSGALYEKHNLSQNPVVFPHLIKSF